MCWLKINQLIIFPQALCFEFIVFHLLFFFQLMMSYAILKVLENKSLAHGFLSRPRFACMTFWKFFAGFRKNLRARLGDGKTGLHACCPRMAILFASPFACSFPHSPVFCPVVLFVFFFKLNLQMPLRKSFSLFIQNAFGLDKYIWFTALNKVFINGCALFPTPLAILFHSVLYKNIQVRDCQIVHESAHPGGWAESSKSASSPH